MGNLFSTLNKLIDMLILAVLWIVCSLPIITIGASSSALYYSFHKCIRQNRSYVAKEFFHSLKDNFKNSTITWVLLLLFYGIQVFNITFLSQIDTTNSIAAFTLCVQLILSAISILFGLYVFPYQSRFCDKLGVTLKNSVLLMLCNLGWSVLLLFVFAVAIIAGIYFPVWTPVIVVIYAWISNRILEHIFRKLMPEEDLQTELELDQ